MRMQRSLILFCALLLWSMTVNTTAAKDPGRPDDPQSVRMILENTRPLDYPRRQRLPLLLWPAQSVVVDNTAHQARIIDDLERRGVAAIATWHWKDKQKSLSNALRLARIQKELGLPVCINANPIMYGFFDGDKRTAHLDDTGQPFFESSIPSGRIGCPFRIDHRYEPMREKVEYFVDAYKQADLPINFVYGDWEIDGPLEINRAWDSARRCTVCTKQIPDIDRFEAFQDAVRVKRAEATRLCYAEPILARYPAALVGNYAVYPHDGYRYWLDYFEEFVEYHPHRMDQRAPCRRWHHEFDLTRYTFAMPVVYPWARLFNWYDFANPDYRWFYSMLLITSNAAKHTDPSIPIIPFVHYHTIYQPDPGDPTIKQMRAKTYQELLWHMLLRGCDTFFLWCMEKETSREVALLHEVWAASLAYADWLNRGTPVTYDVPSKPGPVVSGLRIRDQVLVRRTDFDDSFPGPVKLELEGRTLWVPVAAGECQVLKLK